MPRRFWGLSVLSGLLAVSAQAAPLDPNAYTSLGTLNVSSGTLTINTDTLAAGSEYDRLVLSGLLGLGGALDVLLIDGFAPALGDEFDLFDFGSLVGTFGAVTLPGLGEGLAWDASNLYTDGTLAVTAIPEPTPAILLGLGLLGLAFAGKAAGE